MIRNPSLTVKRPGVYSTAFFGDDAGEWEPREEGNWIFGLKKHGYSWQMIPSMHRSNEGRTFSVDGATEQNAGFRKALGEIVNSYPEVIDFLLSFDGPMVSVREVLGSTSTIDIASMSFLHGTSSASWESIMRDGLRPRGQTGQKAAYGAVIDPEKAGRVDAVYLTTQMGMAKSAARQAAKSHKSSPVILRVSGLDPSLSIPDEDSRESTAEASIARMGSMGYTGVIPPKNIRLEWTEQTAAKSNPSRIRKQLSTLNLSDYGLEGLPRGEHVILYHGTTRCFTKFDLSASRTALVDRFYGKGIFLTPSKDVAERYANANRNIGFDPEIIDDLKRRNPAAGNFMQSLYDRGDDVWDELTREFFGLGPKDDYGKAVQEYIGGVDPNTVADVTRYIIGSKLMSRANAKTDDEIPINIFDMSTGLPDYMYDSLDELGIDSNVYRPKVYTVEVRVSKPLITHSKSQAKSARAKGYDSVIYYGEDLVKGIPEVAVFRPQDARIVSVNVLDRAEGEVGSICRKVNGMPRSVGKGTIRNPALPASVGPLYHGTSNEQAARAILEVGKLLPGKAPDGRHPKKRAWMAPLEGHVYATTKFSYAMIYALGGDVAGSDYGEKLAEEEGRYGWIFEVKPTNPGKVVPDEDFLGEYAGSGADPELTRLAQRLGKELISKQYGTLFQMAEGGEYRAFSRLGKRILKHASDEMLTRVMLKSPQFALAGGAEIVRAWRVDKMQTASMRKTNEPKEQPGIEVWPLSSRNPAAKTKPGQAVKILRADGSTEEVPAIEQFGDLAVVEHIERRKNHGYNIVHIPTQKLFRRQIRTKPETVAQARFYGSVPEGMALLRGILAGDGEAAKAVLSGRAFKDWQAGKTKAKPAEFKPAYWLRVNRPAKTGAEVGAETITGTRLYSFEDALALMLGTEAQINIEGVWARLTLSRRLGPKDTILLTHFRHPNSSEWGVTSASNEPELLTVPRAALFPPSPPVKESAQQSQLPEGMEGFDYFKNPSEFPSEDRSSHPTVVEYGAREMLKGKSPSTAAKVTAKKLSGTMNMFFGPVIPIIDPNLLEENLWNRLIEVVIVSIPKMREDKAHFALDGTMQQFSQKPAVRGELKRRVVNKMGYDPFTNDDVEQEKPKKNPSEDFVTVYHGTTVSAAKEIQKNGLTSHLGYGRPKWYMVAEDPISAAFHARPGSESGAVVIEFRIPTKKKSREDGRMRTMWPGFPYLWAPQEIDWDGKPTRWYALKQPIPPEFIRGIRSIEAESNPATTEAMSAPTFAWRAYVSRLSPDKETISEYVRHAKEGVRDPKLARYVASGLATLVRRRPEFDGVDAVVLMPRRGPEMENDLGPVGKILASELGIRFIPDYLVRTRIPLGGQEVMRRTRYPASEHTATMQVPVTRGIKKPLVLDNVLATGATLNGAYEAIRRDTRADPVGLVILWSPDFWQAPESDRMVRRKRS